MKSKNAIKNPAKTHGLAKSGKRKKHAVAEQLTNISKKRSTTLKSQTDWKRLKRMKDKDIDLSDIPELDEEFFANAAIGSPLKKSLISLRLDKDVIEWFKNGGPYYQTRINQLLRTYMDWCKRHT